MKLFRVKKLLIMSFFVFALLIAPVNVAKAATVLQLGSSGAEVTALQQKLIRLGFYLGSSGADGSFGQYTLDAVKGVQSASGITTDGIVGAGTNTKITEWLSKPAYGASTAHFSQSEFQCSCCGSLGGGMKTSLLLRLEALRAKLGGNSITVNSGYRCPAHNAAVGGEDNSYHMKSVAADIAVSGVAPSTVANNAETIFGDGGLGRYSNFTHVDVRGYRSRW